MHAALSRDGIPSATARGRKVSVSSLVHTERVDEILFSSLFARVRISSRAPVCVPEWDGWSGLAQMKRS